jgi:hypothetical protein
MVWLMVHLVYKIPVVRRFREIGERWILDSPYQSLRPHGTTRLPLEVFLMKYIWVFFEKSAEKIQISLKYGKNNG